MLATFEGRLLRKLDKMVRYTIRDVLWLMVVVGLGVGWWMDHRRVEFRVVQLQQMRKENADERRDLEALRVAYDKRIQELNLNYTPVVIPPRTATLSRP